ncbi:unannotated protein [freshwater metagenome]|uniref:Unannotated protein n=1 Tax=freshwater metagenome TaxID=449393 RepID=A0A6J7J8X4_9ZZZZ|nr:hypothetical protein [Actinomycetota bacterium]
MTSRLLLILAVALCAAAALPRLAQAADTLVVPDVAATEITALDGSIAWVSGPSTGPQHLMIRTATGASRPVSGAPSALGYRSLDLGRDSQGRLVLSYRRCRTFSSCVARRDDLHGHRSSFKGLAPAGCSLTTAPAIWRHRVAYGRFCVTGNREDELRSGLWVKATGTAPHRVPRPHDAAKYGVSSVSSVDLRGTTVGAIYADIYSYAAVSGIWGGGMRSFLAGASEGESDARVPGLALGSGGTLWALTNAEHAGDPLQAITYRLIDTCRSYEVQETPEAAGVHAVSDIAVDGTRLFELVPGVGVKRHTFTPTGTC